MGKLERYYNKFNEDGRLTRRHGVVEYETSMHFIREFLGKMIKEGRDPSEIEILDLGAGTGAYSIPLSSDGYDVTAVEKVVHNLNILKKKCSDVKAHQGDATDLSIFPDETFDLVICFGPLYHLIDDEDKIRCLRESGRVLKPSGRIFAAYCMNEYAVLTYGFKEGHIREAAAAGKVSSDFALKSGDDELYSYVRLLDIDRYNETAGLNRDFIFSQDGPANYMRDELKEMIPELFEEFLKYHIATCKMPELLGAGFHVVDVLKVR